MNHYQARVVDLPAIYAPKRADGTDRVEIGIMLSMLLTIPCPKVLEIGTQYGDTTANFAKVLKPLGGSITTVDVNEFPKTLPKMQTPDWMELDKIGTRIPGELMSAVTQLLINPNVEGELRANLSDRHMKYDLVFIDGDHSYEGVKSDYSVVGDFLADRGVVFFHDVWWDVTPPPVDGPLRLMEELKGGVLNMSHLGIHNKDLGCLLR